MSVSRALVPAALVLVCLALAGPGLVLASDLEPVSAAPDVVVTIDADGVHPREVRVGAGDVVEWRNADLERHRMRSRSGPAEFDSGNLESGERYGIRFAAAGTYPYLDERNDAAAAWHGRIIVIAAGAPVEPVPTDAAPNAPNTPSDPTTEATNATVVLGDDFVDPTAVRIGVGGTVTFRNEGYDEHSATATDGGPIDSGVLSGGATYSATFPDSGTFAFMCIFHSEMQGTVTVVAPATNGTTPTPPAESSDPTPAASPDPTPAASADPDAVVPDQVDIEIVELEFRAPDVTVAAGGQVSWTNIGQAPHTVTASDGSFDSDILEPGAGFEHRFDEPGTFAYLCEIHPGMVGTVEVVAVTADAVADPAVAGGGGGEAAPEGPVGPSNAATSVDAAPTAAADDGALGDLAGLILAVAAVSIAIALFAKAIGGTVRPMTRDAE